MMHEKRASTALQQLRSHPSLPERLADSKKWLAKFTTAAVNHQKKQQKPQEEDEDEEKTKEEKLRGPLWISTPEVPLAMRISQQQDVLLVRQPVKTAEAAAKASTASGGDQVPLPSAIEAPEPQVKPLTKSQKKRLKQQQKKKLKAEQKKQAEAAAAAETEGISA